MNYKYKKGQIFGKRLDVSKEIRQKVYDCTLTFEEFIRQGLEDKIPTSCIIERDRKIVERFGIEKSKQLDWDLIEKGLTYVREDYVRDTLMSIDPETEDIKKELYELVKDTIRPYDYTMDMRKAYSDRYFELGTTTEDYIESKKYYFDIGMAPLDTIIEDWDFYKEKDLTFCLKHDPDNKVGITDSMLKEFMSKYSGLIDFATKFDDIYTFISKVTTLSEEEVNDYIKEITDDVLKKTYEGKSDRREITRLSDDEYKEIFKYSSVIDYLKAVGENVEMPYGFNNIVKELETLPPEYSTDMPFPLPVLLSYDTIYFIETYGIKNIIDFDNECGHFLSSNNCQMLKAIYESYMHYATNNHDPATTIFTKKAVDENGIYIGNDNPYTKEEFYEALRRMIIHSSSNNGFRNKDGINYSQITGEFREKFPELFLPENTPEEVKTLFYSRSFTPKLILEHPEYISFLEKKDIGSCFENLSVRVEGSEKHWNFENFYDFVSGRTDFDGMIDFIKEYAGAIEIVLGDRNYGYKPTFTTEDNMSSIEDALIVTLRKKIIEQSAGYPSIIPKKMLEDYPSMFLPEDAPDELKEAFYSRKITTEFILSNPSYIDYLRNADMECTFKYMPIKVIDEMGYSNSINFVDGLKQVAGDKAAFDIMLLYGKYVEKSYEIGNFSLRYDHDSTRDEFLTKLDKVILDNITSGGIVYDENMPNHFKKSNPSLFLDESLPKEFRDKFYKREFTTEELAKDPNILKQFGSANVIFGLPTEYAWISKYFVDMENPDTRNEYLLRTAATYSKLIGSQFDSKFKEYIERMSENLDVNKVELLAEKINMVADLISRLDYSNSLELQAFRNSIFEQLIEADNPLDKLEKIEDIFLRNNTPLCGKMYLCFKVIYPTFSDVDGQSADYGEKSRMAPEFKDATLPNVGFHATNDEKRFIVMFNDLLRVSYRSNERSLMEYLDNLEVGNRLYLELQKNSFDTSKLNPEEKKILEIFTSHLGTLYDNTTKGKDKDLNLDELPLEEKLKVLGKEFKENERYELKDRIVRTFCYYAGIKSFAELKKLAEDSMKEQKERTKKFLKKLEKNDGKFEFHKGDFVRGIGYLDALSGSINTGNFSKENLGVFIQTSDSDTTPLDVDLSIIPEDKDVYHGIDNGLTGFGFGNLYIVITGDNPNIRITRDSYGNLVPSEYDPTKIEVFGTNVEGNRAPDHWGARTGISLADVDCIVYKRRDEIDRNKPIDDDGNVNYPNVSKEVLNAYNFELAAVKYEIAKNGYYIPVIDFSGKLIYTPEEYEKIRGKMQGLSHFGIKEYKLSSELLSPDVEKIAETINQDSIDYTVEKREKIYSIVKEVLGEMNLELKCFQDGDLTSGFVEFIDTGSTGRNTNIPYDGDFDFFMRLDSNIISDPGKREEFKQRIKSRLEQQSEETTIVTGEGDYRFKKVKIDEEDPIDIDISFGVRTNKVKYSSDECLKDRLETIQKLYPEQYKYVVANIILAKTILKSDEIKAYKPRRTDEEQGGLGGIGVENWILQNGGSFIEASRTFVSSAFDKNGNLVPFEEFKKKYEIWDFGENHFSARKKGEYLYDNFVSKNMNETGYKKMAEGLRNYLIKVDNNEFENEGQTL